MASTICAHCGSVNTEATVAEVVCLDCGERTRIGGGAVPPHPKSLVPPEE